MLKLKITFMSSESYHSCLFENKCELITILYYLKVQIKKCTFFRIFEDAYTFKKECPAFLSI